MSDDSVPPVPPAERVFKISPTQGASGQESLPAARLPDGQGQAGKKPAGDVIKNQDPPSGKSGKGPFLGNLRQLLTKGIHLPGKHPAGTGPQSLFASPIRLQGMDSVKQLLVSGIDLDAINKVLTGVLAVLLVYSIAIAVNNRSSIAKLMQSVSHIKFEPSASETVEVYQPVDHYLGQVRSRDIFNPVGEVKTQVIPEPLAPPEPPKPKLKEMAKDFSVVGIAWGETPKAMIQDSATQEIYFLKKGDMIGKTEIKVKDILRGKVVIAYGEEEMEL